MELQVNLFDESDHDPAEVLRRHLKDLKGRRDELLAQKEEKAGELDQLANECGQVEMLIGRTTNAISILENR